MAFLLKYAVEKGSLWLFFFLLGFYSCYEFNQANTAAELKSGQKTIVEYTKDKEDTRTKSEQIIQDISKEQDGDIAPIMHEYLNRLRKSK